jgi:hypothetical protein
VRSIEELRPQQIAAAHVRIPESREADSPPGKDAAGHGKAASKKAQTGWIVPAPEGDEGGSGCGDSAHLFWQQEAVSRTVCTGSERLQGSLRVESRLAQVPLQPVLCSWQQRRNRGQPKLPGQGGRKWHTEASPCVCPMPFWRHRASSS